MKTSAESLPHYHFKCSKSEADEGGRDRIKGERAREEEREQVGFRVQRHDSKLNEHQICTVSAGWVVERDRMVSRVLNYCKCASVMRFGSLHVQVCT